MSDITVGQWDFEARLLLAAGLSELSPTDESTKELLGRLKMKLTPSDAEIRAAEWAKTVKPGRKNLGCPHCGAKWQSLRLYNPGAESASIVTMRSTEVVFSVDDTGDFETSDTLTCLECAGEMPLPPWMEVDYE